MPDHSAASFLIKTMFVCPYIVIKIILVDKIILVEFKERIFLFMVVIFSALMPAVSHISR